MAADDTDLMRAAGRGDREAFAELVQRHHAALVQFAQRFAGIGLADAEDLAQDCLLAAWQAAPRFRPRATVRTWLFRILTNLALNRRRRPTSTALESIAEPPAPPADQPEARLLASESAAAVAAAVGQLPPAQRAALILRHYHDLSYREIAEVLETTRPAVESLLFRARQSLQKALDA